MNSITEERLTGDQSRDERVYGWALNLTSEQGTGSGVEYLPNITSRLIIHRCTGGTGAHGPRNLFLAVLGPQGVGKTAMYEHLSGVLPNVVAFKWQSIEDARRRIIGTEYIRNREEDSLDQYLEGVAVRDALVSMSGFEHWGKVGYWLLQRGFPQSLREQAHKFFSSPTTENLSAIHDHLMRALGQEGVRRVAEAREKQASVRIWNVLVEFQDYHRRLTSNRNRDLAGLQWLWQEMISESDGSGRFHPNIVIFWQEELWDDMHFIEGKFEVFRIEPTRPAELVKYYADTFAGHAPFTEESLLYLAETARGIWRWWKKYILLCLDKIALDGVTPPITKDMVREWLGADKVTDDWSRELAAIWPNDSGRRNKAVRIIRYLQDAGGYVPQSAIATEFFDSGDGTQNRANIACSRFLDRLEEHNYVVRERRGKEKIVRYNKR